MALIRINVLYSYIESDFGAGNQHITPPFPGQPLSFLWSGSPLSMVLEWPHNFPVVTHSMVMWAGLLKCTLVKGSHLQTPALDSLVLLINSAHFALILESRTTVNLVSKKGLCHPVEGA